MFGFLSTETKDAAGNYGMLDQVSFSKSNNQWPKRSHWWLIWNQVAGLQWVKRHISAFSGDPGSITIMGQQVFFVISIMPIKLCHSNNNHLLGLSCKAGNVRYGGTSKAQNWNYQTFGNFVLKFFQTYVIQLEINNGPPLSTFCSPIMEDFRILVVPP